MAVSCRAIALLFVIGSTVSTASGQDLIQVGAKLPETQFVRYAPGEETGQIQSLYSTKPSPTILFVYASW